MQEKTTGNIKKSKRTARKEQIPAIPKVRDPRICVVCQTVSSANVRGVLIPTKELRLRERIAIHKKKNNTEIPHKI